MKTDIDNSYNTTDDEIDDDFILDADEFDLDDLSDEDGFDDENHHADSEVPITSAGSESDTDSDIAEIPSASSEKRKTSNPFARLFTPKASPEELAEKKALKEAKKEKARLEKEEKKAKAAELKAEKKAKADALKAEKKAKADALKAEKKAKADALKAEKKAKADALKTGKNTEASETDKDINTNIISANTDNTAGFTETEKSIITDNTVGFTEAEKSVVTDSTVGFTETEKSSVTDNTADFSKTDIVENAITDILNSKPETTAEVILTERGSSIESAEITDIPASDSLPEENKADVESTDMQKSIAAVETANIPDNAAVESADAQENAADTSAAGPKRIKLSPRERISKIQIPPFILNASDAIISAFFKASNKLKEVLSPAAAFIKAQYDRIPKKPVPVAPLDGSPLPLVTAPDGSPMFEAFVDRSALTQISSEADISTENSLSSDITNIDNISYTDSKDLSANNTAVLPDNNINDTAAAANIAGTITDTPTSDITNTTEESASEIKPADESNAEPAKTEAPVSAPVKSKKKMDVAKVVLVILLILFILLFAIAVIYILWSEDYLYLEEVPIIQKLGWFEDEDEEEEDEDEEDTPTTMLIDSYEDRIANLQDQLDSANERNTELQNSLVEILQNNISSLDDDDDDWDDDDWDDEEPEEEEPEEEEPEEEEEEDDDWDDEDEDEDDDDWDDDDDDEDEDDDTSSTSKSSSSSSSKPVIQSVTSPHTMTDRDGNTATFTVDEWNYLLSLYKNTKDPNATAEDHTISELRYLLSLR